MKTNTHQQNMIKKLDLRACLFYLNWLQSNKNITINRVNKQECESCRREISHALNSYFPNEHERMEVIALLEAAYDENILPIDSFDWLTKNERATFWLWAYICQIDDFTLFGLFFSTDPARYKNLYHYFTLSLSPSNHQERLELIIQFFDNVFISAPPVSYVKKHVMEKLKEHWKSIYSRPMPLKWLPNEEEAIRWAWEHLQKCQQKKLSPPDELVIRTRIISPGLTTWFTPLNSSERLLALRAALDLWDDAPDTKHLFLLNLNKAWNQQKLRQSRTDKKALNTYLKNETKQRLDFMAAQQNIRISEMLEKLINERYYTDFDNS
ncbi:TPA: hypothetical protein ACS72K_000841 [Providencia alcalifaciens]|uniref:hypothetical protein n=1 Tax=Providencia sp. R33 TaxID=2828763 RepID=UPI001C5ACFE9|nr:hypothetical protein [Providencia sp. R33]QXX81600.1 hypothetical protein J6836_15235 [Providencia sp. R33]